MTLLSFISLNFLLVTHQGLEPQPPDSKSGILTIELMGNKKSTCATCQVFSQRCQETKL